MGRGRRNDDSYAGWRFDMHSLHYAMNTDHMGHSTHPPSHGDGGSHMMQVSHMRVEGAGETGPGEGAGGMMTPMQDAGLTCTFCTML